MIQHDYSRSKYDNCVYHLKLNDSFFVYLLLYIDDILITAKDMCEVDKLNAQLKQEFEMKDLRAVKKNLGMKIQSIRQEEKLFLSQKYIEKVLERFGTLDVKLVKTPFAAYFCLSANLSSQIDEKKYVSCFIY